VWQLERGVYVAATADACEKVLQRTTHEYGTYPGTFQPLKRADGTTVGSDELKHARAAGMRGLRAKAVASRLGDIAAGTYALAADWHPGQDTDVLPRAEQALAVIGSRYLFSADADAFATIALQLARVRAGVGRSWSLPLWASTPARRDRVRRQVGFAIAVQHIIDRRRATGHLGEDVLGHMLRPLPQGRQISDATVIDSLLPVLVATIEPMTRAVGWILLELARHPHAADRVATEAGALPQDPHAVTTAHLDALRYTQAFVREALRLHPPNWLLARRATYATELAGHPVPPGTMVLVCPYTAHRDPAQHPQPDQFRPERWLGHDGHLTVPGAFLPFGTGPRACIGTALALAELTLLTARTACLHHLHEPPGTAPSHRITTDGVLTPADLRLHTTPRT
jgi:cytochrome P450